MNSAEFSLETCCNRKKKGFAIFIPLILNYTMHLNKFKKRLMLEVQNVGGSELKMLIQALLRKQSAPPPQYHDECNECSYVNLVI